MIDQYPWPSFYDISSWNDPIFMILQCFSAQIAVFSQLGKPKLSRMYQYDENRFERFGMGVWESFGVLSIDFGIDLYFSIEKLNELNQSK